MVSLSAVGKGVPDLLCALSGHWFLIEVKGPTGRLTPDQVSFQSHALAPVYLCRSVEDLPPILAAVRGLSKT